MDWSTRLNWHPDLLDPTGARLIKPRRHGQTMIIDKGLGVHSFQEMLEVGGEYIDIIKIGFGSSVLYPRRTLAEKIRLARKYDICIIPGGTFLEMAVHRNAIGAFFEMVHFLGFNGIEVSDGTIELTRMQRNELIGRGKELELKVFTEYGKKLDTASFRVDQLLETVETDLQEGAALVTIEGREAGINAGLYDEHGRCRDEDLTKILEQVSDPNCLMWETPMKSQQVHFIQLLGPNVNLGNIMPADILSLESLRRGLRADTFYNVGSNPSLWWQPDSV